jgi:isocitrate dehydrogenase (NAD+)
MARSPRPVGDSFRSVNARLHESFQLYANVLTALTGIVLEAAQQVATRCADRMDCDERIVDACAVQLALNPWQFDVIVTTNLFGGLGFAPGASIGADAAIFEAVHGSALDIAGKGIANPVALLLAAGLMLEHVGRLDLAQRLRAGIDAAIVQDGARTRDMGGTASTAEFAAAVARRVG